MAAAGADLIDLNMGCPVRKVCKTGAGAALIADPDLAVEVPRRRVEGAAGKPVTVKLRSGLEAGDRSGVDVAARLANEAGAAAVGYAPAPGDRSAQGSARTTDSCGSCSSASRCP